MQTLQCASISKHIFDFNIYGQKHVCSHSIIYSAIASKARCAKGVLVNYILMWCAVLQSSMIDVKESTVSWKRGYCKRKQIAGLARRTYYTSRIKFSTNSTKFAKMFIHRLCNLFLPCVYNSTYIYIYYSSINVAVWMLPSVDRVNALRYVIIENMTCIFQVRVCNLIMHL